MGTLSIMVDSVNAIKGLHYAGSGGDQDHVSQNKRYDLAIDHFNLLINIQNLRV